MTADPPPRIGAGGIGETPPTAGLPPRWRDLIVLPGRRTLEAALCERFGFPDIEIVSTGTAGLLIAFAALKERHPDRNVVVVPGYTCPLVVLAAAAAGLDCIACDTVAGGFELDPGHLRRIVGPQTLAVVPTHYGGVLTDVAAVRRAVPGIAIVEDAAQALGASWHGRTVGLEGDIGVFSLGAGKGLTIYEGGALVARDTEMMATLRRASAQLTSGSAIREVGRALMLMGYHAVYNRLGLRLVFGAPKRRALARNDEIEAAGDRFEPDVEVARVGTWRKRVGRNALSRLDAHLAESRAQFEDLAQRLQQIPGLHVHVPRPGIEPSATSLFVSLPSHPERASFIRALWASRIGVTRMFSRAIGDYPEMQPLMLPSETPNAREIAAGTIAVSTSTLAARADHDAMIAALADFARIAGWTASTTRQA